LTSDRLSNFTRIDVDTKRGVVSLNGTVQNQEQRVRAERLAHQVNGVIKVNNNLHVQNQLPKTSNSSTATSANDDMRSGGKGGQADPKETTLQTQRVHIVQGTVSRIEGDTYFVQGQDGKEVNMQADPTTMKSEKIKEGDRIEAKVDENNHALSMLPAP
jgi:BON domain